MAEILQDAPDSAQLVDTGTPPETVTICGTEFELKEWTMSTRELWHQHAKKHGFIDIITAYSELTQEESELFTKPQRIKTQRDIVEMLEVRHAKTVQKTYKKGVPSEARRVALFEEAEALQRERDILREMENPAGVDAVRKSMEIREKLEPIKAQVRDIRLRFAHILAKQRGEKRSYEKWKGDPTASDFRNAEALIVVGKPSWEDHAAPNRARRRAAAKARK